jgi:hypothetical protein
MRETSIAESIFPCPFFWVGAAVHERMKGRMNMITIANPFVICFRWYFDIIEPIFNLTLADLLNIQGAHSKN